MNDKDRIQELEITLSHQDQQIADLSEMIILQGREIAKLQRQLGRLENKLQFFENDSADGNGDDAPKNATEFAAQNKPPHF